MAGKDAFAVVRGLLLRYGLGSLANWAWQLITADKTPAEIELELFDRPEFKQRFSALFERERLGLSPMSPDEIIEFEATASQMARAFNLPTGFMTRERINRLIVADVSNVEVQQRMELFAEAAFTVPQEVRTQLRNIYGVDEGQLAAFFIDPDQGAQMIRQQFLASQTAAAAQRQGFGQLSRTEAERIATLTTPAEAEQRFAALQQAEELFTPLPGSSETAIGRETQLALVGGDVGAQEQLERRARRRTATFEAGGQFATTEQGVSGLGSASR